MTSPAPITYGRLDQTPRVETDGFEHLNNFVLFNDGQEVMVKVISQLESLTSNLVQCTKTPLSPSCRYYRMTLKKIQEGEFVMFGLTNKCLPGAPMWTIDRSVRYHSNDGGIFNGGMGIRTYHPYSEGDTVTCRLDYVGPDRSLINFLMNDCFVYRQWVNLPPDQLYATIGVSRANTQITVEWPQPGRGDITIRNDLPSNWFGWKGIARDDETMTFTMAMLDPNTEREAYNVQCPLAFTTKFRYFEIEIMSKSSEKEGQGIGLVSGNCESFVYPGWTQQSIGYHNDDGGLYIEGEDMKPKSNPKLTCKEGDRMGCGVVFPRDASMANEREPILVLVYFTKNGELAYTKRMRQPRGGFFPCIALFHKGDEVKLDVTCDPPEFGTDLTKMLATCEVSADYRCTEQYKLRDLTQHTATVRMDADNDTAQLLQYRAQPLRDVGDSFSLQVLEFDDATEIQIGVSTDSCKPEGEFLGAEKTSSGYMLKLGTVVSKDGMRAVAKWKPGEKQTIACYLDYIDDGGAVVCFTIDDRLIGRGVVSRATGCSTAIYASIVISAGPAEVKVDWTGILNSTKIVRQQKNAEDWLRPSCIEAKGDKLELKPTKGYAFAASAQSSLPLITGSSIFGVRLLSGQELPGLGLSRATNDVNNVLGSELGEICFVPSGGHVLTNNVKKMVIDAPEIRTGDLLQCGVVFSRPADRVPQKVVVFFAINGAILHHCRLQASYGGLYPTVAFSSTGGCLEIVRGQCNLPVPDAMRTKWLEETEENGTGTTFLTINAADMHGHKEKEGQQEKIEAHLAQTAPDILQVYASHAFADREQVDYVLTRVLRAMPYLKVETSISRVSLQDKHDVITTADMIVLFVSAAYYNSHEMLTEYNTFIREAGVPVVFCALEKDGHQPRIYFNDLQEELNRLPRVELSVGEKGKINTMPLERHIDKRLRKQRVESFTRRHSSVDPRPNGANHKAGHSSRTCVIV